MIIWEEMKDIIAKTVKEQNKKKEQMRRKYRNPTAVRLRESMQTEMQNDFVNLYKNHYNACYSGFAKKILEKNHFASYRDYQETSPG